MNESSYSCPRKILDYGKIKVNLRKAKSNSNGMQNYNLCNGFGTKQKKLANIKWGITTLPMKKP